MTLWRPEILVALAGAACTAQAPVQTSFMPAFPERNAAGDPIVAVYDGRVPCAAAGCRLRKIELVLYGRDGHPTTYWLGVIAVGLGNDRVVREGGWTERRGMSGDAGAKVVALDANADPGLRHLWRAGPEVAILLDADLRLQRGDGTHSYALNRNCAPWGPRTYPVDPESGRFAATERPAATCG